MISTSPAASVFVAIRPIDMREGYDGLCGLVAHHLGEDPRSGHLFVFPKSQRTQLKFFSGTGRRFTSEKIK
jgi:transposase